MAETVALKINVDAGNSVKTLGSLEKEIKDIGTEMLEVNKINIEFKEELKKLEAQYRKIPKTSLSARKKIKGDMDALKEAIQDNNIALENFRLKKREVNQMKKDLKSVSHGFERSTENVLGFASAIGETVAGFMLLTGVSEENTEKIEKALGVMFAFEGVAKSITHATSLWNESLKGNAIIQGIVTGAQKTWNFVTQASTSATKLLRLALLSLPFVAIGVAIATVIQNFDKLKSVLGGLTKRQKALNETMDAYKSGAKTAIQETSEMEATFELARKGVISKEEALEEYNTTLGETFGKAEDLNTAEQLFIDKTKAYIESQSMRAQASVLFELAAKEQAGLLDISEKDQRSFLEKSVGNFNNVLGVMFDWSTAGLTNLTETSKEFNKQLDEDRRAQNEKNIKQSVKTKNDLAKELLLKAALNDKNNKIIKKSDDEAEAKKAEERRKRIEEEKRLAEERLKREQQAIFDLQVAQKQADAEDILDEKEKAEALIEIERFKHEKELENIELTNTEKELLEFEYQQRIADISQEFVDMELEKEQAEAERLAELQKEKEEKEKEAREKKLEADKESAEKRIALEKEIQDAQFNLALGGIDALIQLNDAFQGQTEAQQKKAFERNKKLQIAQALISASQGIVNILSNASTIPDPFGTIYKVGQIGVLAGVTAAQISKISQAQFSGGGTLNTPNINGTGGGQAPQLSPITNTSTLVPQEPQQVFVTETDITQTQNKVAVIEEQATIK